MPIRHCEKCGLKVLIDDSQTGVNPFYCQRCTSSMKAESRGDTAKVAAPAPSGGAKAASVKVNCPHCKASFNGRLPKKPAKGSCPVCQKELILLPTGEVRAAAGFDVHQWLKEQEAAAAPPPEEPPPSAPVEAGVQMPDWLDEAPTPVPGSAAAVQPLAGGAGPQGETFRPPTRAVKAAPPPPVEDDILKNVQEMPEPAPDAATEEPMPPAAEEEPPPPAAAEPAAPEAPVAPAPPRAGLAGKKGLGAGTARRDRADRAASAVIPTGGGRVLLALILVALPIAAIVGGMPMREKLKGSLGSIGERVAKGFYAIYEENFATPKKEEKPPPPPEPPKEKPPEPPKEPEKPDKDALKDEINKLWMTYMREKRTVDQKAVGATPAEKEMIEQKKAELQVQLDKINERREQYKKFFGEDYDPTKAK